MDGFTPEELEEMIGEMDEGDLMEACDEVSFRLCLSLPLSIPPSLSFFLTSALS